MLNRVKHRAYDLSASFIQHHPAHLGKGYPIVIVVANTDNRALDAHIDLLLQPSKIDNASVCFVLPFLLTLNDANIKGPLMAVMTFIPFALCLG